MVSKAWSLRGHSSGSKSQSIIRVNLKTQALDHCSTAEIHFYEARGPAFKFLQAYYFRNTLRRPLLASALVKRRVFEGSKGEKRAFRRLFLSLPQWEKRKKHIG